MSNIKIAPSVLAADFTQLGQQIQAVENAKVDQIHIDIMDGRFVPNISMGPLVVEAINRVTDLTLDVHLMIVEPEKHIEAFAKAGSDIISVHVETCPNLHRTLQQIRDLGVKAGVAINPHTPASAISEILHLVDVVLVMTVNPGFGGQSFLSEVTPKISQLREMIGTRDIDISVDGGIAPDTIGTASLAGANVFIAGSSIFKAKDGIEAGVKALHSALLTT